MNLLLFIPSLADGKGGAERVAGELGTAMRRRGHRVAYAFDTTFNEGQPQYPVPPDAPLLTYNASFLSQVHLREKIAALGPDLILVFYANWRVKEYCHLLDGLGIPLAFQECANPNRVLADNWAHAANARRMRADILVRAAGIRFTQPRYTESLPAELRGLADAFPNAFARAEAVRDYAARPKTILHVGGAKANKNADVMLDAFALLAPRFPDWRLVMCTPSPRKRNERYERLKESIHARFSEGRVILLENVEGMERLYADARIHCLTSLSEGLPNCVCEAMCQATPSVGFAAADGVNTLIRHDVDGLLAEPRAEGLAASLASLMGDEAVGRRLGLAALEAAARFEPETVYDRWEAFLERSLARGRKTAEGQNALLADSLVGRWDEADGRTWAERLERRARALSGEVLFYGCGDIYARFRDRFSHLHPVAMLLDTPNGRDKVDGINVVSPAELDEGQRRLPCIIFSREAPVLAHRLRSLHGVTGEMLPVDARAWQGAVYVGDVQPVSPSAVKERRERAERGAAPCRINVEPMASRVNIESPDCAFCGASDLVPYLSSEVVPWYDNERFRLVRCRNCGLVFNSPRPTEEYALRFVRERGEYFYQRKLNRPDVQSIHDRKAAEFLRACPDARDVFDVGFGAGTLLHAFRKLGLNASGNEVNEFAVRMLRGQGFEVTGTPTLRLERKARYDMVTMLDYLEHTYTPFDDLLTVHAMLRPGGMLHLKTLYLGCPSHAAKGELWQLFGMGHFYYFTPQVLRGMIRNAGFDIVDMRLGGLIHISARKLETTF